VRYGRLLEIGRELAERQVRRSLTESLIRFAVRKIVTSRKWFGLLSRIGGWVRPALPSAIAKTIPARRNAGHIPSMRHPRRMLLLDGCVQPALIPVINAAVARVLDRAGISVVVPPKAGCCGALSLHLGATAEAEQHMRGNIDAWWPEIEKGCEAVVMTASGCGVTVREYGQLLARDHAYAERAARISSLTLDLSEVIAVEKPNGLPNGNERRVAYHAPCTLQHGQKVHGKVEEVLRHYGWQLATVREAHLCCGSAGSYSLLQPRIANQLLQNKLAALQEDQPELIASANIGCLLHLGKEAHLPVRHWIELLDPAKAHK
jgi:glycolate oxidase iron-sulfur subunit